MGYGPATFGQVLWIVFMSEYRLNILEAWEICEGMMVVDTR